MESMCTLFSSFSRKLGTKSITQPGPSNNKSATYDDKSLTDVIVSKNRILKESLEDKKGYNLNFVLLRPLIAFLNINKTEIHVLDLGGSAGTHFFIARRFLSKIEKFKWAVIETPSLVEAAKVFENEELQFFVEIESAKKHLGKIDLILASSVFQYMQDPLGELEKIINLDANWLFITRTALSKNESTSTHIQKSRLKDNGPGPLPIGYVDREVEYPITIVNKLEFKKIIQTKYKILFEIEEDKKVHKFDGLDIDQWGFFCEKI